MSALQVIWFLLLAFLLTGFTVLSGFDLGIGLLRFFTRGEEQQSRLLAVIGPYWDGNEVWLLAAGGASFAAFPPVYATVFSGLYIPLMVLLFAIIVRAVSIDFGAKAPTPRARNAWGIALAVSSTVILLLLGVAFGNILRGLPLNAQGDFVGSVASLLNPFALLFGVLNVAMLATHGARYLRLKVDGDFAQQAKNQAKVAWAFYVPLAVIAIIAAAEHPHLLKNYLHAPYLWFIPLAALAAIVYSEMLNTQDKPAPAFFASTAAIVLLLASAVTALFPTIVPALHHPEWNLTLANSSASHHSLSVMLVVALIGMPLVLIYTSWVYRVFAGPVKEGAGYH